VSVDNVAGAQVCVRHLINQGHRRIGIITGSLALQRVQERLEGYQAALREASIELAPELILEILEGNFHQTTGYRLAKSLLLQHQRPTALFVPNGMVTIGAIQAMKETGLWSPTDIAIAAFDDLPLADVFQPHLTAVAQPAYQIGYKGAELLILAVGQEDRIPLSADRRKLAPIFVGTPPLRTDHVFEARHSW
jgi:LacI family transcriptional regulator